MNSTEMFKNKRFYLISNPKSLKTGRDKQLGDCVGPGIAFKTYVLIIYRNFIKLFCIYRNLFFMKTYSSSFLKTRKKITVKRLV